MSKSETLSGIPGSGVEHHGAPYSLTEEFVSVYRLHSLLPDDIKFYDLQSGQHRSTLTMNEVVFERARNPLRDGLT
ncbi:MAG: hypothetical protein ABMA02_17500 [Saprospiraceae bacterium]